MVRMRRWSECSRVGVVVVRKRERRKMGVSA